jgi:flagellar operon protein
MSVIDKIFIPEPIQVTPQPARTKPSPTGQPSTSFASVLDQKLPARGLKFSQHAQERLAARGISLNDADLQKLEGAVNSVAQKGGKDSLIMMGDAAFVVSVNNRTVVTAVDRSAMQGNVFTKIDSAVIV